MAGSKKSQGSTASRSATKEKATKEVSTSSVQQPMEPVIATMNYRMSLNPMDYEASVRIIVAVLQKHKIASALTKVTSLIPLKAIFKSALTAFVPAKSTAVQVTLWNDAKVLLTKDVFVKA
ncbi:hypothetical protein E9993_23540, partial [Labilibacter sediminis]